MHGRYVLERTSALPEVPIHVQVRTFRRREIVHTPVLKVTSFRAMGIATLQTSMANCPYVVCGPSFNKDRRASISSRGVSLVVARDP